MKINNILDIIRDLNDQSEKMIILKYENIMVYIFSFSTLFLGSIANFLGMYFIFKQDIKVTLINSLFLLGFSLLFKIFSTIVSNENFKSYIFTFLLCCVLVFTVVRFYYFIGPTVWTISLILVMISMVRIKKSMLTIMSLTIFLLGSYVWYLSYPFSMGAIYYVAQNVSFAILFIITAAIHKINTNRYYCIKKQFQKNKEMTFLYKETKSSEKRIKHIAYHDHLTGLPNRLYLSEQLNHSIFLSSRMKKMLAIMFLDLDNFKIINTTMGHDIGDQLLVEVSKRLVTTLRKCDTVARIGGDEFVILINYIYDIDYINVISEKVIKCFNEPFKFNNREYFVTTSLGVAIYPTDGETAEVLIKNADIAMYQAKEKGKNKYEFYSPVVKDSVKY